MAWNTFKAFRSRNYILYFVGQSISLIGTWMQKTAVSWVVYSLTHSRFMLGVTLFASLFPSFLFSTLGGIAADRYNKFRLMMGTQAAALVQGVLLTAVVWAGNYSVWGIIVLTALLGLINAFDVPARQTIVYDMVIDENDLPNALALNSSMVNLTRLIGPALAGFILQRFGETICFGINAISYVAVIASLLLMRHVRNEDSSGRKKVWEELKDGFGYIVKTPEISSTLIVIVFMSLLVVPFTTLIPVYAQDIFKGNASTFGVIDSFIGGGAFFAAIDLASLKAGQDLKRILLLSIYIFCFSLLIFAWQTNYYIALLVAAAAGFGMMAQITTSNTLLQTIAVKPMRGRVVSYFSMAFFGMQPIGGLLVGIVSQRFGAPVTVFSEGIVGILIAVVYARKTSAMRSKLPRRSATDVH